MKRSFIKRTTSAALCIALAACMALVGGAFSSAALNTNASQNKIYMRFPGGLPKCATFSFDDGLRRDEQTIDILLENNQKATFFLVPGYMDVASNICTKEGAIELYSQPGLEVANHTQNHKNLSQLDDEGLYTEVVGARNTLESMFKTKVIGLAYPNGDTAEMQKSWLAANGVKYARTVGQDTTFSIPKDWLHWDPTAHCIASNVNSLFEKFIKIKQTTEPKLFYMWGHSYDFDNNSAWGVLNYICTTLAEQDNVWSATNGEVYNYCTAFDKLQVDVSADKIYNPTSTDLWFSYSLKSYKIKAGATFTGFFANPTKWLNEGAAATASNTSSKTASKPSAAKTSSQKSGTAKSAAESKKNTASSVSGTDEEIEDDESKVITIGATEEKQKTNYVLILTIIIGAAVLAAAVVVTAVLLTTKKKKPKEE